MTCWDVYLCGRLIDSVFYAPTCSREYVRASLIDHDGYPNNIDVRKGHAA